MFTLSFKEEDNQADSRAAAAMLEEEDNQVEKQPPGWNALPFDILCSVFSYLTPRQRYRASCVSWLWYEAFFMQRSWDIFVYKDYVFTRRKYLQVGPQYVPDYYRLRFLINRVASLWRVLIIHPVTMFFNMYEFLRALTNYCEYYDRRFEGDSPLISLRAVEFSWYCKFHLKMEGSSSAETEVYGTGGQLLKGLTNFLANLVSLQVLVLRHLLLDFNEAEVFLADLLNFFGDRLHVLSLRNLTKLPSPVSQVAFFLRLKKLVLSPSNLSDDLLELLCEHRCLRNFVLIQDDNTPACEPISSKDWVKLASRNPFIRVFIHVTGRCESALVWQPHAPVVSVVLEHPAGALAGEDADRIIEYYSRSLRYFAQKGRQRRYRSKSYADRADPLFIRLVEECKHLEVLGVRERISSATALYLAHLMSTRCQGGPGRVRFLCRRKAVLKRTDFIYRAMGWSQEFYTEFSHLAQDYGRVQSEIGHLMGVDGYRFLSDNDYRFAFENRGNYME